MNLGAMQSVNNRSNPLYAVLLWILNLDFSLTTCPVTARVHKLSALVFFFQYISGAEGLHLLSLNQQCDMSRVFQVFQCYLTARTRSLTHPAFIVCLCDLNKPAEFPLLFY